MVDSPHDVRELEDSHNGERAFVLGNGWSVTYYDTTKMAQNGTLIGCNKAFQVHPIDYLVFQDQGLMKEIVKFDGVTFCPFRKGRVGTLDPDKTFYYNFAAPPHRSVKREKFAFDFMHSGGLALQTAVFLGFSEIIMVGCDCCFIKDGGKHKSNIFEDKHFKRVANKSKGILKRGKPSPEKLSVSSLERFAQKFNKLYNRHRGDSFIRQMGDWGILDIPSIDYEDFWSDTHPGRKELNGACNTA